MTGLGRSGEKMRDETIVECRGCMHNKHVKNQMFDIDGFYCLMNGGKIIDGKCEKNCPISGKNRGNKWKQK